MLVKLQYRLIFLDFLRDVRNGMVTFASISGKRLSRKAPNCKHSAADVFKKIEKNIARERRPALKSAACH